MSGEEGADGVLGGVGEQRVSVCDRLVQADRAWAQTEYRIDAFRREAARDPPPSVRR
jgi:hypothetical protein